MPMSEFLRGLLAQPALQRACGQVGALSESALDHLDWRVREAASVRALRSIETGCGVTTLLLGHYARHHSVYAGGQGGISAAEPGMLRAEATPDAERITRIDGPVCETMLLHPLQDEIDIAILGGIDGYPATDLAFAAIGRRLRPGALLVISDIRIPTTHQLYRFLLDEEAFQLDKVAITTAFFRYLPDTASKGPAAAWSEQRYNAQRFPAIEAGALEVGAILPVRVAFDGVLHRREPHLLRGFTLKDGSPVTEGPVSHLTLKLAAAKPAKIRIGIDLEPLLVPSRRPVDGPRGVSVCLGSRQIASVLFEDEQRRTIEIDVAGEGEDRLDLVFHHLGLPAGGSADQGKLTNFRLHAVTVAPEPSHEAINVVGRVDGSVVSFDHGGRRFFFMVDDLGDSVQSFHAHGRFYELDELEALRSFVGERPRILEVGAHVGNHTVYFAAFFGAATIVPIEPNPRSQASLRVNCRLNHCTVVDLSRVDCALGAEPGRGRLVAMPDHNSGGASVERGAAGSVRIATGDELFAAETFDLIKIDVEGMELEVLAGLSGLVERCRPLLFIEVRDENAAAFLRVLDDWCYGVVRRSQMYEGLTNIIARFEEPRTPSPSRLLDRWSSRR